MVKMKLNVTLSHFCSLRSQAYATPLSPSLMTLVWPSVVPEHKIIAIRYLFSNLQYKSGNISTITYIRTQSAPRRILFPPHLYNYPGNGIDLCIYFIQVPVIALQLYGRIVCFSGLFSRQLAIASSKSRIPKKNKGISRTTPGICKASRPGKSFNFNPPTLFLQK